MADRGVRRRTRTATGLTATAVVLAAGLLPAQSADAATATAATVTVAPAAGGVLGTGALRVDVAVENEGEATLAAGTVQLALEQATVADPDTLTARLADPTPFGQLQGYGVGEAAVEALAPGARAVVTITVPAPVVDAYTQASGAHLVAAQLRVDDTGVAAGASTVVRAPTGSAHVRLATVVPVTLPVLQAPTGVASAEVVDEQSSPGGAWAAALDALRADPAATLALDPAVLASIRLLGTAAPASATTLLQDLAELPNTVVELPYADGDVTLERAAGAARVLAPTGFAASVELAGPSASPSPSPTAAPAAGRSTSSARDLTTWAWSSTRVGWPVGGTIAPDDLPFLARSGDSEVLLSSSDVRDTAARRAAGPEARIGGTSVLVADAEASALLATAAGEHGPAAAAAYADLLGLLAVDAGGGGTPTVLAVPARTASDRLGEVLARLREQRWLQDADLDALTASARPAEVSLVPHRPDPATTAAATALVAADHALTRLGAAVPNGGGSTLTAPYRLSVLAMLGAGWRQARATWATWVGPTTDGVKRVVTDGVQLQPLPVANTLGATSSLPFYVRNSLPVPVRVVLSAVTSNGRVIVPAPVGLTVAADDTSALIKLPIRSIASGEVQVTAQLATPDGLALGDAQDTDVSSQPGWDTLGAGVFLAALLALFVVGVYRNLTRRRRTRAAAA